MAQKTITEKLADTLRLPITFAHFDPRTFNPRKDTFSLTHEGVANLKKLAEAMKADPNEVVEVAGHVAPQKCIRSSWVSLEMARYVKEALAREGCTNLIAAKGLGVVEGKPSGIQTRASSYAESEQNDKEMEALENTFETRLAKALTLEIPFVGVGSTFDPDKDTSVFKDPANANLDEIARVLKESPGTCIRVFGYTRSFEGQDQHRLSAARTRMVREALLSRGCKNAVYEQPMGHFDEVGPRCEADITEGAVSAPVVAAPVVVPAAAAQTGSIIVSFKGKDREIDVPFTHRPLGFWYWEDTEPVLVSRVREGSQAAAAGVEVGMEVTKVSGQAAQCRTFNGVHPMLQKAAGALALIQTEAPTGQI